MWRISSSFPGSDEVPQVLKTLDLAGIVDYMKSDACKRVFVMAGAGISTSAGIPDFRSPDTGLYANLARLKLPYPEAVFDIRFFRRNPLPFYTLAHELAPGQFRPTLTHSFIRLLAEKKLLHTCFTQNIDTLERRAGVPASKIVEAHGSFAEQHCIECGASFPDDKMRHMIETQETPRCERKKCNGLVKPDIVFFGEALPTTFHTSIPHLRNADLLIVMGTSLTVHPFASLTDLVPEDCPRLLINLEHVGGWGSRVNDVACLRKCDDAVRLLCKGLGWEEELDELWNATASSVNKPQADKEEVKESEQTVQLTEEEKLKDEVEKLTKDIEKGLKVAQEHEERTRGELSTKGEVQETENPSEKREATSSVVGEENVVQKGVPTRPQATSDKDDGPSEKTEDGNAASGTSESGKQ